jgi:hypothetical protein
MPTAGFEPAVPAIERLQTRALDHAATGTDHSMITLTKISTSGQVVADMLISLVNSMHGTARLLKRALCVCARACVCVRVRARA